MYHLYTVIIAQCQQDTAFFFFPLKKSAALAAVVSNSSTFVFVVRLFANLTLPTRTLGHVEKMQPTQAGAQTPGKNCRNANGFASL
jgi:hypothetical protein